MTTPNPENDFDVSSESLAPPAHGVKVSLALFTTPPYEAEIVTVVFCVTRRVLTVNMAELVPAGIVTEVGTTATAVLLLVSFTTAPPTGATRLSVTVPWEDVPPFTLAGFSLSEDRETVVPAVCTL